VAHDVGEILMPEVTSHDRRYIEPERHDGLSTGVPAARSGTHKRDAGRFVGGPDGSAIAAGAKGGKNRKGTTKLSHRIDAPTLSPTSQRRARVLRRALAGEIASTVGGGHCGIAASLFIKFASQKTAAAEEAFARGDFEDHRKLSESARMDVLYAREHAAKEAAARPRAHVDHAAELQALAEREQP
jgi:hypothetical protein